MARPASQAAPPPRTTLTSKNTPSEFSSERSSGILTSMFSVPAALEIGRSHLRPLQQFPSGAAQRDHPVDHDIAAVRQPQGVECVLLYQEHGEPLLGIELLDRIENLAG